MDDREQEESTALMRPPGSNGNLVTVTEGDMVASWDSKGAAVRHSFDATTDEGKAFYMQALKPSDMNGLDLAGKDLHVANWFVHVVELTDQKSFEQYKTLRLVWLLTDGKIASTTSPSLISGWGTIVNLYKPWVTDPALIVKVIKIKAKRHAGHYLAIDSCKRSPVRVSADKKG